MIRWEQDEEDSRYWYGRVGNRTAFLLVKIDLYEYELTFHFDAYEVSYYHSPYPSSAKRGAKRLLKRFLKDAGLEVKCCS